MGFSLSATTQGPWLEGESRPKVMRWLCYAYVVSLFFEMDTFSLLFRKSETITQYVGTLMFIGFLYYRLPRYRLPHGDAVWVALFSLMITGQEIVRYFMLSGDWWTESWNQYFLHIQVLVMFFLLQDTFKDLRALRGTLITIALSLFIAALMTILGIGVTVSFEGRTKVSGIDLNQLSWLYGTVVIAVYTYFLVIRWKFSGWRLLTIVFSSVIFVALVQTGSRGGFLTVIIGIVLATIINFRWQRLPIVLIALAVSAGFVSVILTRETVLWERLMSTQEGVDFGKRDILAEYSWELVKQKPLFGWGGSYYLALGAAVNRYRAGTHNTYLQTLISFGLTGSILFFAAWISQWWRLWKRKTTLLGSIALCTALSGAVFQLTGHKSYDKHFWLFFALSSNIALLAPDKLKRLSDDITTEARRRYVHASSPATASFITAQEHGTSQSR